MKPTQEQVIAWAREAGISKPWDQEPVKWETLEQFANLVAAAEREACAKVLDEMADDMVREMDTSTAITYVRSKAAEIRSRTKP